MTTWAGTIVAWLAAGVLPAAAANEADRNPPQPNVVLILADDLGRADCGFMGGRTIRTPRLDALAAAGTILDAFYVQPVCSPTRAALLTGRYPMRHGLQVGVVRPWAEHGLPLEERTLAQALRGAGYATAIIGKWHLGHAVRDFLPTRRGFDRQYGHYNGAIDYFTHFRDEGFDWHSNDAVNRDEGYATRLIAREAVRFVKEHAGRRPFFLYVPFNAVHAPLQVPEEYLAGYEHLPRERRQYAGMLAALDEAVGEIVDAVKQSGAQRETLFIFSSDNGGPRPGVVTDNGPFRAGKGTLYEGGVRVAAFATWEGRIPAGKTVREPLHAVDWYPTLIRLCGGTLEQPLPIDGRNLWPTLTENAPSPHETILINTAPAGGAVRSGPWKLIVKQGSDDPDGNPGGTADAVRTVELYHLGEDPGETRNVAADQPEVVARLTKRLEAFAAQAVPPKNRPRPRGFRAPAVWGEP